MNGMIVNMKEMKCDCGMSAMYDNNNTVSFVDAAALVAASPDNTEVGVVNSIILESEIPVMSFEFHDIKWYESYAEVSAVMTEIDTLITEDKDESFGYIEIGEEDNDITQLGCPFYYNLHMERIVTMPTLKVIKE